jgi:Cytochrome P450
MSQPIPQPKGLPLLGNVLDVKPSNTWASLKKLAETHGEIFKITVLGHTIVFVAGASLAEEITDEKRALAALHSPRSNMLMTDRLSKVCWRSHRGDPICCS